MANMETSDAVIFSSKFEDTTVWNSPCLYLISHYVIGVTVKFWINIGNINHRSNAFSLGSVYFGDIRLCVSLLMRAQCKVLQYQIKMISKNCFDPAKCHLTD